MKEITILSGKGGTGKTSITAALASLATNSVYCDNDVDAADLHLIFHPDVLEEFVYEGAWIMELDQGKCTQCRICEEYCRFDAIHSDVDESFSINPFQCEGCRLCERVCPTDAISAHRSTNSSWFVSDSRFGKLVHAKMGAGEENSGKLVTLVRKKTKEIANEQNSAFIINDGPPGIGCSTIASLTGTDLVLMVIEPTKSGLHDLKRLIGLIKNFNLPAFAIINKYDIKPEINSEIEDFLQNEKIPVAGKIPFDKSFVESLVQGKTIIEYAPHSKIVKELNKVWKAVSAS